MFSKSDYTRGLQCPKMLWMRSHIPEKADESLKSQSLIDQGHEVGDLAKGYFGPYAEIANDFDYPKMEAETRAMLMTAAYGLGPTSVCEACFTHDGLVCMADIVRFDSEGRPHLVEVKSSTKAKPNHIDDAAFQAYVMQKCGWEPASVSIMHIDGAYVRNGDVDVHGLFSLEDVTADVMARMGGKPPRCRSSRQRRIGLPSPTSGSEGTATPRTLARSRAGAGGTCPRSRCSTSQASAAHAAGPGGRRA